MVHPQTSTSFPSPVAFGCPQVHSHADPHPCVRSRFGATNSAPSADASSTCTQQSNMGVFVTRCKQIVFAVSYRHACLMSLRGVGQPVAAKPGSNWGSVVFVSESPALATDRNGSRQLCWRVAILLFCCGLRVDLDADVTMKFHFQPVLGEWFVALCSVCSVLRSLPQRTLLTLILVVVSSARMIIAFKCLQALAAISSIPNSQLWLPPFTWSPW